MSMCICGHYESEHAGRPVSRCLVRYGAWSDQPSIGEMCDCPGYEPDPERED